MAYDYDRDGQLAGVRDANGNVARRFAYENGLMASHVNALGFECRYEWAGVEGRQRVVASSTSEGERWTFDYDPAARRSTARDGLGRRAEWTYDEHFQMVACRDLDGSRYRIAYNAAGLPATLHLPGERQVNFEYDEAGRLVGGDPGESLCRAKEPHPTDFRFDSLSHGHRRLRRHDDWHFGPCLGQIGQNHHRHPAIALPAFRRLVWPDRLRRPVPYRGQPVLGNPALDEQSDHAAGAHR